MDNNEEYKFILCSGLTYTISSKANKLNDINPRIFHILFSKKQYKVESNVSDDSFLLFLNYLIDGKEPTVTESNRPALFILSQEFQIMRNLFYQNSINYLHTIQLLQDEKTENKSQIEDFISINLDEFLEFAGKQLFDLPITSLYNIMTNKKRNLAKHNSCYELIKQCYERNHNDAIFVLLPSLDGKLLSDSNLEDSISSQAERNGFMVKIEYSYILDLKKEFDQYKNEQKMLFQQMQQQILELKNSLPNQNQGEPGQIAVLNQQKNGYVWQIPPFSIYFKATLNNHSQSYKLYNGQNGSVIPFDKIICDSNNAFDINAHAYRVPVAGKWLFFGQIFHNTNIDGGVICVGILKGDKCYGEIGFYKDIKQNETLSCSSEVDCQAGDLIYLYTHCISECNKDGTFLQGFFLSP